MKKKEEQNKSKQSIMLFGDLFNYLLLLPAGVLSQALCIICEDRGKTTLYYRNCAAQKNKKIEVQAQ